MSGNKDKDGKRIAIFTGSNYIFAFPLWVKTIPELKKRHDIVGIYLFLGKRSEKGKTQSPLWYFRVFGLCNLVILGLYSVKAVLSRLTFETKSWGQLAAKYNISLNVGQTPNSNVVYNWVKENNIDIIFITLGVILKENIINAPNIGIINEHSAILPSCRGVFPFFWARLNNLPTGMTFHKVDTGIDTGSILLQRQYPIKNEGESEISMLRFYIDVLSMYPTMAPIAAEHLISKEFCQPCLSVEPSYHSFPTKEDYKIYRSKSYKIAKLSDLFISRSVLKTCY